MGVCWPLHIRQSPCSCYPVIASGPGPTALSTYGKAPSIATTAVIIVPGVSLVLDIGAKIDSVPMLAYKNDMYPITNPIFIRSDGIPIFVLKTPMPIRQTAFEAEIRKHSSYYCRGAHVCFSSDTSRRFINLGQATLQEERCHA